MTSQAQEDMRPDEAIKIIVSEAFSLVMGKRKQSKCRRCKSAITFASPTNVSFVRTDNDNVIHVCCNSSSCSLGKSRGYVLFCIQCKARAQQKGNFACKCNNNQQVDHVVALQSSDHPVQSEDDRCVGESVNLGGLKRAAVDAHDNKSPASETPTKRPRDELVGASVDNSPCFFGDDCVNITASENDELGNVAAAPQTHTQRQMFQPEKFFTEENGWKSDNSRKYFIHEHNACLGKAYLVSHCLLKGRFPPEMINQKDIWYTLFAAARYYKLTRSERGNISSMINEVRESKASEAKRLEETYQIAIKSVLSQYLQPHQLVEASKKINNQVNASLSNYSQGQSYTLPDVRSPNDVRTFYTDNSYSIVMNLPCPNVHELVNGDCEYAAIDAEDLINHILALYPKVKYYKAGDDDAWDPSSYVSKTDSYESQVLAAEYFQEVHNRVKTMLHEGSITTNTRVAFCSIWSDGFEAHHVAPNNDYNSLQVYTVRVKGEEQDFILPSILAFKKKMDKSLIHTLILQMRALEEPVDRYWKDSKESTPTVIFCNAAHNDLPERCISTGIAFNGTYSKRFGFSNAFESTVPSCIRCLEKRTDMLLDGSCDDQALSFSCNECKDWWSSTYAGIDRYPIPPGFHIIDMPPQDMPSVKLSFEMMENSLDDLHKWNCDNHHRKGSKTVVLKYIRMLCIAGADTLCNEMMDVADEGGDITDCQSYPIILRVYKQLGVDISYWPTVAMHMFFLGLMKNLTKQSNRLMKIRGRTNIGKEWWDGLRESVLKTQEELEKLCLVWCSCMNFNTNIKDKKKKKHLMATGWMSENCVAFARVLLFQFSPLDEKSTLQPHDDALPAINSFRSVLVLFFCLCSNAFANRSASPTKLDHLVRMFLSACVDYHNKSIQKKTKKSTKKKAKKSTKKKAKKSTQKKSTVSNNNGSEEEDEDDSEEEDEVFFHKTSNYFSILNLGNTVRRFGSVRYVWEGEDEKFIKNLKREISTLRHDTSALKVILEKLLRTLVLDDLNKDNPLYKNELGSRLFDFKVYTPCDAFKDPVGMFDALDYIQGVIDDSGVMFICFEPMRGKGIQLHQVHFHDEDGGWILNLWHAKPYLTQSKPYWIESRHELNFPDYFLLLKQKSMIKNSLGKACVICKSWKVRMSNGTFDLPMPMEEYLKFYV